MARTKKPVFVLIAGKAGTGKTSLANYLVSKLGELKGIGVIQVAFANEIKTVARKIFGWTGEKDHKGRRLLQVIGTECGREYDEDIWVRKTVQHVMDMNLYPPNFIIIDDWRFPNECYFIKNQPFYDVVTIRIEAPNREQLKGTPEENHPSETSLPSGFSPETSIYPAGYKDRTYDYVLDNTKDFTNLYSQADEILAYLEKDFILE
jgi:hypothetical protein